MTGGEVSKASGSASEEIRSAVSSLTISGGHFGNIGSSLQDVVLSSKLTKPRASKSPTKATGGLIRKTAMKPPVEKFSAPPIATVAKRKSSQISISRPALGSPRLTQVNSKLLPCESSSESPEESAALESLAFPTSSQDVRDAVPEIITNDLKEEILNCISSFDPPGPTGTFPMTSFAKRRPERTYGKPNDVLQRCDQVLPGVLSDYEREEILLHPRVYTIGRRCKKPFYKAARERNNNLDRKDGRLDMRIGDHIAYRYQVVRTLGRGNSSEVFEAYDMKEKRPVALKVFKNTAGFLKMGFEEWRMISRLAEQDPLDQHNLAKFYDAFMFRRHLIFSGEVFRMNLLQYMDIKCQEHSESGILHRREIIKFAKAILEPLALMEKLKLCHLDVKPENILISDPSDLSSLKLIDLGSAREWHQESTEDYIQTRYYRAPEVIMGQRDLDSKVDAWSFGCVLAELHLLGPVLLEGADEKDQMVKILEMFGMPSADLLRRWLNNNQTVFGLHFVRSSTEFVLRPSEMIADREPPGPPGSKKLETALRLEGSRYLLDFFKRCLRIDPKERSSPSKLLDHDLLKSRIY